MWDSGGLLERSRTCGCNLFDDSLRQWILGGHPVAEAVLEANVRHVVAHEEDNENVAFDDLDHEDNSSEDEEPDQNHGVTQDTPMEDVIDDR